MFWLLLAVGITAIGLLIWVCLELLKGRNLFLLHKSLEIEAKVIEVLRVLLRDHKDSLPPEFKLDLRPLNVPSRKTTWGLSVRGADNREIIVVEVGIDLGNCCLKVSRVKVNQKKYAELCDVDLYDFGQLKEVLEEGLLVYITSLKPSVASH